MIPHAEILALRDEWGLRDDVVEKEDLDFTVVDDGPETPEDLLPILSKIGTWLRERTGIDLEVGPSSIRRGRNRRGSPRPRFGSAIAVPAIRLPFRR